jgi:hypothetical protein
MTFRAKIRRLGKRISNINRKHISKLLSYLLTLAKKLENNIYNLLKVHTYIPLTLYPRD